MQWVNKIKNLIFRTTRQILLSIKWAINPIDVCSQSTNIAMHAYNEQISVSSLSKSSTPCKIMKWQMEYLVRGVFGYHMNKVKIKLYPYAHMEVQF